MDYRNPQLSLAQFRQRLLVAAALVLICFLILFGRFYWLQVARHDYYITRAENNRISIRPVQPNRGLILDRHGEVLAQNISAYTLELQPKQIKQIEQTIDALAEIIEIDERDRARFNKRLKERPQPVSVTLRSNLSDEEVAKFIARRFLFPGVDIRGRLFRQYPRGALASHALGYIGRIADVDLRRIEVKQAMANYRGAEEIGKNGLEHFYEFELHGETGSEQVEVDAVGRAVRVLERSLPQPGMNLNLTLDAGLQAVAEAAFADHRGALLALDPSSGEVLAMVSMPHFDPNLFIDGIAHDDWQQLNQSADKPLLNRALKGTYPPGSTFKPFMALAALATGLRQPQQAIDDPGYFEHGDNIFRDDKPGGHGKVDMHKSIVESCDTYYYELAIDLGIERIATFMARWGFGQLSGIDLSGEATGVLPSKEWKKKRFKSAAQKIWYSGETVSIGIGQGYNAYTPLQLAVATATLANDGVMMPPHLLKSFSDSLSGEQRVPERKKPRQLGLKPADIDVVKRAMLGVNTDGTAARVFAGTPYRVAGKTGTAQVFSLKGEEYEEKNVRARLRDHSLYIAFAPYDKPRIALAVVVENAGFGSRVAAPIARKVLDYYLLGTMPPVAQAPAGVRE